MQLSVTIKREDFASTDTFLFSLEQPVISAAVLMISFIFIFPSAVTTDLPHQA